MLSKKLSPKKYLILCLLTFLTLLIEGGGLAFALSPSALEYYDKARAFIRENRLNDAEMALHQAITFDAYDPLLFIALGEVYQKKALLKPAIEAYERAAQLDAKDPAIYYTLGNLYEQKQDYEAARYNFQISQQKNPTYSYVNVRLARLFGFEKKYPEAIALYETYLNQVPKDFDAHRQVARFAVAHNQAPLAIEHLLFVKQESPSDYKDEALLAKAYLMFDEPQKALSELALAKANGRDSAEVANLQSVANEKLGRVQDAIDALQIVVGNSPEDTQLQYRLAFLYAKANQYTEALKHLTAYIGAHPEDLQARVTQVAWLNTHGSYVTAKKTANDLLNQAALSTPQKIEVLTQNAFSALKTGDSKTAASAYEQVLAATPKTADNYRSLQQNLGVAYYESGQLSKALGVFQDLLASQTLSPGALALVKKDVYHIYLKQGQLAGEAKQFDQAKNVLIEAKPYAQTVDELQDLRLELGALYLDHNYSEEAIALYEEALLAEPNNIEAALNLSDLWRENHPEKALPLIENILKQPALPEDTRLDATYYKASALIHLNQKTTALPLLESLKAKSLSGKTTAMTAERWMDLGTLYHEKKAYTLAEEAYQKSLALEPNNALAAYNLGSVYLAEKKYPQARTSLNQALQGEAAVTKALYALGVLEEQTQNKTKALAYFKEYLQKTVDLSAQSKAKVEAKIKLLSPAQPASVPSITAVMIPKTVSPPPASMNQGARTPSSNSQRIPLE
jgi:tetratricopeptide (TPR) repeat protein